jgi:hypothetical protein
MSITAANVAEARRAWSMIAMAVTSLLLWALIIESVRVMF